MTKLGATLSPFRNLLIRHKPFYVYFYVTARCNISCQMCFSANYLRKEKELDLAAIRVLAGNLREVGVGMVCLTGGEPLVRKDLPSIIKILSEQGLVVHLQTNGFNVSQEKIKEVVDAGCNGITVSLHSLDPQKHDYICGQSGVWQDTIKTLANVIAESPERGFLRTITAVVSRHNLKELPALVRFATKIGFFIFLPPLHLPGFQEGWIPDYFFSGKKTSEWKIRSEDFGLVDSVYQELLKLKRGGFNFYDSSRFLKESVEFLKYGRVGWKKQYQTCAFPGSLFFITADGHFDLCGFEESNDVSVLASDFTQIFYGKEFRDRVEQKVKKCKGCMCAMAEASLLTRDLGVLLEKALIGMKMYGAGFRRHSYQDILKFIGNLNNV